LLIFYDLSKQVRMARKKVMLNWELNSNFGWGLLGLNVFFHWARDPDLMPVAGTPIDNDAVRMVDPLRLSAVSRAITASNELLDVIERVSGPRVDVDGTVIDPISHNLRASRKFGKRNIGRCVFENTDVAELAPSLQKFDALLCGSNWNADILRSATQRSVKVIYEGIDPSLFCPGPRSGILDPTRFYVFSGGKVEFRKGQDLVLRAFREFSQRHRDAVLVTAWHSPWPQISLGFKGTLDAPLGADANGMLDVKRWVADNGIDPACVIELFSTPNQLMPMVLREMDVAVQPSRAEACTNLPVKEAMACGVPVIVGDNTGMKDLITEDNCIALSDQRPVVPTQPGSGTEGWGESDVGEIVDALERVYVDRSLGHKIGTTGARWMHEHRTWQKHASQLKDFVLSLD
jgi:glycosyltransferase involved in cell wall biosynthesis